MQQLAMCAHRKLPEISLLLWTGLLYARADQQITLLHTNRPCSVLGLSYAHAGSMLKAVEACALPVVPMQPLQMRETRLFLRDCHLDPGAFWAISILRASVPCSQELLDSTMHPRRQALL